MTPDSWQDHDVPDVHEGEDLPSDPRAILAAVVLVWIAVFGIVAWWVAE